LGWYILGVLKKTMADEKRDYDLLTGVSVGSLIVTAMAQEPLGNPIDAFDRAYKLFLDVPGNEGIYEEWPYHPVSVIGKDSIYSTQPLRDRIDANLDASLVRASGRQLRIGAVSWETGAYHAFDQDTPNLGEAIYASSAFPMMFEEGLVDGEEFADGGLRTITPLADAIRAGATEIDVIMASNPFILPKWDPSSKNLVHRLMRMLAIVFSQIMIDDLKSAGYDNDLATFKNPDVNIRLQMPSTGLEGFDSLDFDPQKGRDLFKIGYKEAYVENF
jgi:NTE family protein